MVAARNGCWAATRTCRHRDFLLDGAEDDGPHEQERRGDHDQMNRPSQVHDSLRSMKSSRRFSGRSFLRRPRNLALKDEESMSIFVHFAWIVMWIKHQPPARKLGRRRIVGS